MVVGDILVLCAGVVVLYGGAELIVAGARRVGHGAGLRPATVGVTVVAFATTTPELFVATVGALTVSTDLGLGAIVGSNIANVGLVLGVSALIRPIRVSDAVVRRDLPAMVIATLALVVVSLDGRIGRLDGVVFLLAVTAYTGYLLASVGTDPDRADRGRPGGLGVRDGVVVAGGIAGLFIGSRWLIQGGHGVLSGFGVPDLIIGLTVIAVGTSLPELAASAVGAARGHGEFAIGNVVGSNIYNVLAVLGVLAVGVPVSVSRGALGFELPVLVAFTALFVGLVGYDRRLGRVDGAVLLLAYAAFVYTLFL